LSPALSKSENVEVFKRTSVTHLSSACPKLDATHYSYFHGGFLDKYCGVFGDLYENENRHDALQRAAVALYEFQIMWVLRNRVAAEAV
jgi:hypothetical protein